jgi:hypothetical protein
MSRSLLVARDAVKQALEKEEWRYETEGACKAFPPSKEAVAQVVAALSNFAAAEASLVDLLARLESGNFASRRPVLQNPFFLSHRTHN